MIPPLISFDLAKSHLRITNNDLDSEIDIKMRLASAIVANHCKLTEVPDEWIIDEPNSTTESDDLILAIDTDDSPSDGLYIRVPGNLQAAVLLVLTELFDNGGGSSEVLSDTVKDLLTPFRDPTMA